MEKFQRYETAYKRDKRVGKRTAKVLEQLSARPNASICEAMGIASQAKAAYRLLANDNFGDGELLSIQREQTINRMAESGSKVILVAEDTTTFNYSGLKATSGLGPIDSDIKSCGFMVHSALAVTEEGQPLGILAQKHWTRNAEEHGKKKDRRKKPIEEKESNKWLECMDEANVRIDGVKVIHVCDRESDIYEFFAHAEHIGADFVCRRVHDRALTDDDVRLNEHIKNANSMGSITVEMPSDSHSSSEARTAKLTVKFGETSVCKTKNIVTTHDLPDNLKLCFVSVVEENPPEGASPIAWHLVTNLSVDSFEAAVNCVKYYIRRWLVERFHYVLKSGCELEAAQLKDVQCLFNLEILYTIIAVEILYLTYLARTKPDSDASEIFSDTEWKYLYCVANKTNIPPDTAPTILEAVVLLAKLGGFLARKSDGFPGLKVLWRGIARFRDVVLFAPFVPLL